MISKKELLKDSLVCVILDRETLEKSMMLRTAEKALRGGADMIQLRDKRSSTIEVIKTALALRRLTKRYGASLIINDRVDAAFAVDSDGVHIGRSDLSLKTCRELLGPGKIIGASAASLNDARRAKAIGADYIGVGPVFRTPIKASAKACGIGLLKKVRALRIPIMAIGGIDSGNISVLTESGFRSVAVIRAVSLAKDPLAATKKLKEAITI